MSFKESENKPLNNKSKRSNKEESRSEVKINSVFSNPIAQVKGQTHTSTSANRLYGGYSNPNYAKQLNINYQEILKLINETFATKDELGQLFYSIHNILSTRMQINCSAIDRKSVV